MSIYLYVLYFNACSDKIQFVKHLYAYMYNISVYVDKQIRENKIFREHLSKTDFYKGQMKSLLTKRYNAYICAVLDNDTINSTRILSFHH